MIVEVNDAGEVLVPAEIVQTPPHTRLEARREGDAVVLEPVAGEGARTSLVSSLPVLKGRLVNAAMTYRREDIYGADGR